MCASGAGNLKGADLGSDRCDGGEASWVLLAELNGEECSRRQVMTWRTSPLLSKKKTTHIPSAAQ